MARDRGKALGPRPAGRPPAARANPSPLAAAAGSDPGRERESNEDQVLCDPERGIFAVIDGVGGESGGEVAAQIALDTLQGRLSRRTTDPGRLVREAIALANRQIYERAEADPRLRGMACVLTVAVLDAADPRQTREATIGHVGDSRLYLLRRGEIRKITPDHSPVGSREDAGEISEADAMRHPRRNEIFRDVGSAPHGPDDEGFIDVLRVPFEPENALLLCSDGLSDMVASRDVLAAVEAHAGDPKAAVADLIARANAAGGKDNVSVVLVEGARFAESLRPRQAAVRMAGAGHARESRLRRLLPWFFGLALAAALAVAAVYFLEPVRRLLPAGLRGLAGLDEPEAPPVSGAPTPPDVLRVGTEAGAIPTIAEALAQAAPGQTVEVAPGEYAERLQLKAGVRLVSAAPRGAVLRPPAGPAPVVAADGVRGAGFSGFQIAVAPDNPYGVGLRLVASEVTVENVEISGAPSAGIEIDGADRSLLRFNVVRGNPGTGIRISGNAAPRLLQNLIVDNGGNGAGAAETLPGIEIGAGSRPQLVENSIEGNGVHAADAAHAAHTANIGPQVLVPEGTPPAAIDEIRRSNNFGQTPKNQTVRGPEKPKPAQPARRPPTGRSRGNG